MDFGGQVRIVGNLLHALNLSLTHRPAQQIAPH
jgi:hypothetical protein